MSKGGVRIDLQRRVEKVSKRGERVKVKRRN